MNRKLETWMTCGLLLAGTLHAAEPAGVTPSTDAEPAVQTSPAAATPPRPASGPARSEPAQPAPPTTEGARPPAATPAASAARGSADRIELDVTQITGNAELPRVLYVVPWKRPELGDLGGRPAKSLLDEVLEPVDRDVFRRQNRYYEALRPDGTRDQQ